MPGKVSRAPGWGVKAVPPACGVQSPGPWGDGPHVCRPPRRRCPTAASSVESLLRGDLEKLPSCSFGSQREQYMKKQTKKVDI